MPKLDSIEYTIERTIETLNECIVELEQFDCDDFTIPIELLQQAIDEFDTLI
jgi:hypothetical protein